MLDLLRRAVRHRGGYAFRGDLLDLGLDDRLIGRLLRGRVLERIRHGTYALTADLASLTPERRHLLTAWSVVDKLGDGVVLSHHTAAIAHGCLMHDVDLSTIHLTRLNARAGRTEAGVTFHVGAVDEDDLCVVEGRRSVRADRAVIESCSLTSVESGMVTASFALRGKSCTLEELETRMQRHERWPGMLNVRLAVGRAEPRCESVGEVRSMYMFSVSDIPRPEPQVELWRGPVLVARNDFGWLDHRHVGEFDGLVKYGRLNPYAEHEPGQVLVDEKRREDDVRDLDLGMSRWTWSDLDPRRRSATTNRIRAAMERSRRLYLRNATHLPLAP